MYKILFVCTGNLCRGPIAEGIMQKMVRERKLGHKYLISSAATHSQHKGKSPDFNAIAIAKKFGIDISYLRSCPFRDSYFTTYDMILVMDQKNLNDLKALYEGAKTAKNVHKLLEFAPKYGENVPDPMFSDNYDEVFKIIHDACENILNELESKSS